MEFTLAETNLIKILEQPGDKNSATFVIEPLLPGYGTTLGNSLRRVLLSSLPGAAPVAVKIEGADHEFSTIAGVKEDIIEIILNIKKIRLQCHSNEPVVLKLNKKGAGEVTASDFEKNPQVTIVDPNHHLATLNNKGRLNMEIIVELGRGYQPIELRREQKMPLGTIALDAIFTPIRKINYRVENTRVGGMTNFDKLIFEITTDGTITPSESFKTASKILSEHFGLVFDLIPEAQPAKKASVAPAKKAPKKKTAKAKSLKPTKSVKPKKK